jgi:hypothetical protein
MKGQFSKDVMFNDYYISFIDMCVKTLNDIHCEMEGVPFKGLKSAQWTLVNIFLI